MNLSKHKYRLLIYLFCTLSGFQGVIAQVPFTDPTNSGAWVLNTDVSDEFDNSVLDENKWLIQGKGGVYKSNFIGRSPSQFSTNNVRIENNILKLQTKWDPTFPFKNQIKDGYAFGKLVTTDATFTCPITTAAVIAKTPFLYGYMEVMCKAANASVASAFWGTGTGLELDVFEHFGKPSIRTDQKIKLETEIWSSIHDWTKPTPNSVWTDRIQLPFRVAGGFHIYGLEWDANYVKIFADGVLIRTVTKAEVETTAAAISLGSRGWVLDNPLYIWLDSETFPWHGLPAQADLPADYEIEYLRVWQKSSSTSTNFTVDLNESIKVYSTKGIRNEIVIDKPDDHNIVIAIYDAHGRNLFSKEYRNNKTIKISSSDLIFKPGIYLVRLSNNAGVITKKIII